MILPLGNKHDSAGVVSYFAFIYLHVELCKYDSVCSGLSGI